MGKYHSETNKTWWYIAQQTRVYISWHKCITYSMDRIPLWTKNDSQQHGWNMERFCEFLDEKWSGYKHPEYCIFVE